MNVMETQRRKQHNFTENNMWALLWHGLPVAALLPLMVSRSIRRNSSEGSSPFLILNPTL